MKTAISSHNACGYTRHARIYPVNHLDTAAHAGHIQSALRARAALATDFYRDVRAFLVPFLPPLAPFPLPFFALPLAFVGLALAGRFRFLLPPALAVCKRHAKRNQSPTTHTRTRKRVRQCRKRRGRA